MTGNEEMERMRSLAQSEGSLVTGGTRDAEQKDCPGKVSGDTLSVLQVRAQEKGLP